MIGKKGVTKWGFGGLLKAGIPAIVIRKQGDNIDIRLDNGNIYHGEMMDFTLDEGVGNDSN